MTATSTTSIDKLIHARWIIPIRPQQTVLEHYAIAINGNNIIELLPSSQARDKYQANETIELMDHVLTPGLINAHGHAAMSLFRGMADDQELYCWLENHIWPAEGKWVDEQFVQDGSQLAIAEMLRSGTTCFSDMYFFPNITAQVAVDAGIRAQLTFPVFEHPSAWGEGPDDYIRKGLQVRDDFKHSALVNVVFGPHATYTVGDDAMQRIATLAAELDIHIHIHAHETVREVDDEVQQSGKRPIQRLNELGILSPKTQLVHMTALTDGDIDLVAQTGAHIIHCPESNLKLASGLCPVQTLRNKGINVALGTDGAASNNSLDLFGEMRTAALLAKAVANDAAALTDWEALEMATLNGAKALGLDDLVGSLEVGKQADIIAIDLSALEQQPVYQPISQLVYTACGHHVSHSWINGQCVMKERQLTTLNLPEIIKKANHWRNKINGKAS
jgi:5-methylthioadenosine/S-adenosylhomocysteine deaminase